MIDIVKEILISEKEELGNKFDLSQIQLGGLGVSHNARKVLQFFPSFKLENSSSSTLN